MISIIICSINKLLAQNLKDNIATTIGVPFEIIIYNNLNKPKGICSVYNSCAKEAKYENLVFVHEDVIFRSQDWGEILMLQLKDKNVGLIGVAGATIKTIYPSPWWGIPQKYLRLNIIQHKIDTRVSHNIVNIKGSNKLAVVDGVFLGCRKEVWSQFNFDETNFAEFHNYDTDFSLAIGTRYAVIFEPNILIEHLSHGSYSINWIESSIVLSQKWSSILPTIKEVSDVADLHHIQTESLYNFLKLCAKAKVSLSLFRKYLLIYYKTSFSINKSIAVSSKWIKRKCFYL